MYIFILGCVKKNIFFFSGKSFNSVDIDLKMHLAYRIHRTFFSRCCWIDIYRWKLMPIKRPCETVWSRSIFAWCILWSTTRVQVLWSCKKKNMIFDFCLPNCLQEEVQYRHFTSKLSTYFSRAQIFGKFVGVWGLLHECGTTGAQRTGTFLLNLGLRKMCSKLLTLSFTYEFFWQCSIPN